MKSLDIIRAWKDEAYRLSLSAAERAQLPENPAGAVDLSDAQLEVTAGAGLFGAASDTSACTSSPACPDSCGQRTCTKIQLVEQPQLTPTRPGNLTLRIPKFLF